MKFEMNFVYSAWDPNFDGERVFYADDIDELRCYVESDDLSKTDYIHYSEGDEKPFGTEWDCGAASYKLIYFDPDYKSKIANQK